MATKTAVTKAAGETLVAPADLTTLKVLEITRAGGKIRLPEVDGEQQAFEMLAGKLSTESAEELFGGTSGETVKSSEIIDRAFRLDSVEFRNADLDAYPESIGVYAVLHIVLDGSHEVLISGANDVVLKSMRAVELGVLPRWLCITEATTKSGRTVQNLVDATQGEEAF